MPNYDPATGIHYGVISPHSLNGDALSDVYDRGDNLSYESAKAAAKATLTDALRSVLNDLGVLPYGLNADRVKLSTAYVASIAETVWDEIEQEFNDGYDEQDNQYRYEQDGYILETTSLGIYVIKSPYYTYAAACSPCCPNAGDLNTPHPAGVDGSGGLKTYCLGPDWFDDEYAPIPYPVY